MNVGVQVPKPDYDELIARAQRDEETVPDTIRRLIREELDRLSGRS